MVVGAQSCWEEILTRSPGWHGIPTPAQLRRTNEKEEENQPSPSPQQHSPQQKAGWGDTQLWCIHVDTEHVDASVGGKDGKLLAGLGEANLTFFGPTSTVQPFVLPSVRSFVRLSVRLSVGQSCGRLH